MFRAAASTRQHRAPPHVDPDGQERIMFIVSFLARPKKGDPRQLSRGTYFHQKWVNWGHVWRDLSDPHRYMIWAWLKSLGLYSRTPHYGYDLVTATWMRFSNSQFGDDLTKFVNIWDAVWKMPEWLHGPNLEYELPEKEAWKIFIEGTLQACKRAALHILLIIQGTYLLVVILERYARTSKPYVGTIATRRLLFMYGCLVGLYFVEIYRIRVSEWGEEVSSGRFLQRPFPSISDLNEKELDFHISQGPTTLPNARDVLIGSRLDASWLGSYRQLLDFHPANWDFYEELLIPFTSYYAQGRLFQDAAVEAVRQLFLERTGARFLWQDYRTGDWKVLNPMEQRNWLHDEMAIVYSKTQSTLLAEVNDELSMLVDTLRFNVVQSRLTREGAISLLILRNKLIPSHTTSVKTHRSSQEVSRSHFLSKSLVSPPSTSERVAASTTHISRRFIMPKADTFPEGSRVWLHFPDSDDGGFQWERGDVLYKYGEDEVNAEGGRESFYSIALESGQEIDIFPSSRMYLYEPITESDEVYGCFEPGLRECFPATVSHVSPSGAVDLVFEDEEDEYTEVMPSFYFRYPFAYISPDFVEPEFMDFENS